MAKKQLKNYTMQRTFKVVIGMDILATSKKVAKAVAAKEIENQMQNALVDCAMTSKFVDEVWVNNIQL